MLDCNAALLATKVCTTCGLEKELSEFAISSKPTAKSKGLRVASCKACYIIYLKNYRDKNKDKGNSVSKAYYHANKDRAKYTRRELELKRRKWFKELKATLRCIRCGESHPACFDFHHVDGNNKEHNISNLVTRGRSLATIQEELDKCIVLCANCHRKLHYKEIV